MKMKTNEMTDLDLDTLLAAASEDRAVPSDALMARVMADAVAAKPNPLMRPQATHAVSGRWLDRLAAVFGGGGALAGISLAMVAGVFIGIVQPGPVAALTSALLVGTPLESVEMFPSEAALWEDPQND
jgi:hypothetical protein